MMTAEEQINRLRQIERRQREIEVEHQKLSRERRELLAGQDGTRRSPAKALSSDQIDAAFAGIIARAK
jgi:hypothetical protein